MEKRKIDKIFYNGTIYTADEKQEFAEAVAISGKHIVQVGKKEEMRADGKTEWIDLKKKMLVPGFVDSHAHPSLAAVEVLYKVDLNNCESVSEYISRIKAFMQEHKELDFIMGAGWINPHFDSHGPRKELLDQLSDDIPMVFNSGDHHSIWANSKAIQMAGINSNTKSPEGGVIEKDDNTGEPAGTFRETAQDPLVAICPDFTVEQYKNGLLSYQREMAGYGITMAHDAMLQGDAPQHRALLELDWDDQLLFKMTASFENGGAAPQQDWREYAELIKKSQGKMFTGDRVKFFIDGVVEGGTAYLKEPYADQQGYYGGCIWDIPALEKMVAELDKARIDLHFHVIGDRATDVMLTALEKAEAVNGDWERRPIAAHVQILDKNDFSRLKRENVHISTNPYWFVKAPGYFEMETGCLGKERAENEYFMKSLFEEGLVVGAASDYPVTIPPRPLDGMQVAMTRALPEFEDKEELILGEKERISMKQALQAFTINGAKLARKEMVTGSIEPGKLADLVVLEQNLFGMDPYEIRNVKVLMTMSEGRVIYEA